MQYQGPGSSETGETVSNSSDVAEKPAPVWPVARKRDKLPRLCVFSKRSKTAGETFPAVMSTSAWYLTSYSSSSGSSRNNSAASSGSPCSTSSVSGLSGSTLSCDIESSSTLVPSRVGTMNLGARYSFSTTKCVKTPGTRPSRSVSRSSGARASIERSVLFSCARRLRVNETSGCDSWASTTNLRDEPSSRSKKSPCSMCENSYGLSRAYTSNSSDSPEYSSSSDALSYSSYDSAPASSSSAPPDEKRSESSSSPMITPSSRNASLSLSLSPVRALLFRALLVSRPSSSSSSSSSCPNNAFVAPGASPPSYRSADQSMSAVTMSSSSSSLAYADSTASVSMPSFLRRFLNIY